MSGQIPKRPLVSSKIDARRLPGREAIDLPRYIEGENLIIAALLTDRSKIAEIIPILPEEAFTDKLCRLAYQAIKNTIDLSDTALLAEINTRSGDPEASMKLVEVLNTVENVNIPSELVRVVETYNKRRIIIHHDVGLQGALKPDHTVTDLLENGIAELIHIGETDQGDKIVVPNNIEKIRKIGMAERLIRGRVLTGFNGLDALLTEGFVPGDISVISARPNIGKSAFKQNLIINLCEQGRGILNVVPEVGFQKEQDKLDAIRLGEIITTFYNPDLWTDDFKEKWQASVKYISKNWKYWCQPDPGISFARTEYDIKRFVDEGLNIVFVDLFDRYKELSEGDNMPVNIKRLLNRQKGIAIRYNVHICNIVQIRRMEGNPLAKARKFRPTLEDLKDAGGYEEVSDLILLLYRPAKYLPEIMDDHIIVIVAKQKTGISDVDVALSVDWETLTMEDMDEYTLHEYSKSGSELNGEVSTREVEPASGDSESDW